MDRDGEDSSSSRPVGVFSDEATEEKARSDPENEKIINEEYKIWKKNVPFLYDLIITHALEWPSLTVQWFPEKRTLKDQKCSEQRLLLGTHTSGAEPNYLMVGRVRLPLEDTEIDATRYDETKGESGGFPGVTDRIEIVQRISHEGEVNRARIMPQKSDIVASRGPSEVVYVFDLSQRHSKTVTASSSPWLQLAGHTREGYGLSWNHNVQGYLSSCADDGLVCLWDINAGKSSDALSPVSVFKGHEGIVGDVTFSPLQPYVLASVGDDSKLVVWDSREKEPTTSRPVAHQGQIHCVSFNPVCEYVLASGASDKMVHVWDLRSLGAPLQCLSGHNGDVFQCLWSPTTETLLASSGSDRRVHLWDLSRIGEEQSAEDADDGPPELLFIHGGHTSRVSDFSWSSTEPLVIASTADDNILQIWQMAENILLEEDGDEAMAAEGD